METPENVHYRVSMVSAGFMVAFAFFADIFQVLLTLTGVLIVVSGIVAFIVGGGISLWLRICGVSFMDGKKGVQKFLTILSTSVVELIPLLDALPTLTIGTIILIRTARAEDVAKARAEQQKNQAGNDNGLSYRSQEAA